ncbi:MAG: hypothetical protein B6D64_03685 [Bacteroidetes bacterium 4484_276]|nr:MAG: hypothetical protein B6D64_03685 [Bacteroidetes bacterium 4484_276]
MEDWSVGGLECWRNGVMEDWSVGGMEGWSVGVLGCWGDLMITFVRLDSNGKICPYIKKGK